MYNNIYVIIIAILLCIYSYVLYIIKITILLNSWKLLPKLLGRWKLLPKLSGRYRVNELIVTAETVAENISDAVCRVSPVSWKI